MAIDQRIRQRPRLPPTQFDDETTRLLCASARLQPLYADAVLTELAQPNRAIAPTYGVDLRAVARHAARTGSTHLRRNLAHTMLLLAGFVILMVIVLGSPGARLLLAVVGAVAVLAWAIEFVDLWTARREALMLLEPGEDPVSLAVPISPRLERRLAKLDRMNVVVYDASQPFPFVGSGWMVSRWSIPPIDVTRSAPDDHRQRHVLEFNVAQLHDDLATAVRTPGSAGVHVSNRLYVRGPAAAYLPGVLDGQSGAVEPIIESEMIRSILLHPQRDFQTYLCLEKITFGGQLAVSMFVHAMLERNLLTVTADCFFLPPLQRRFWAVTSLPRRPTLVLAKTVLDAAKAFPRDLMASPVLLVHCSLRRITQHSRVVWRTRRIQRGHEFNYYGAATGIREDVADLTETRYVDLVNEERYLRTLQAQVIEAIIRFLERHHIDTTDLRKQRSQIVTATVYNFQGKVEAPGSHFGDGGRVDNSTGLPPRSNPTG